MGLAKKQGPLPGHIPARFRRKWGRKSLGIAINSCGVREWVNAIKEISTEKQLEFVECSLPMIKQFNMVTNFGGHGKIISFMAPYFCPQCNKQFERLIVLNEHLETMLNLRTPVFSCPQCGGKLEFDDLEDKYFQFILRQESVL